MGGCRTCPYSLELAPGTLPALLLIPFVLFSTSSMPCPAALLICLSACRPCRHASMVFSRYMFPVVGAEKAKQRRAARQSCPDLYIITEKDVYLMGSADSACASVRPCRAFMLHRMTENAVYGDFVLPILHRTYVAMRRIDAIPFDLSLLPNQLRRHVSLRRFPQPLRDCHCLGHSPRHFRRTHYIRSRSSS